MTFPLMEPASGGGFDLPLELLPALYAELHYRKWFLPSFLYRDRAEVIADLPARLEPGWESDSMPVLLYLRDAHRFPCTVESVRVQLWQGAEARTLAEIPLEWRCRAPFEHRILGLPLGDSARSGQAEVRVCFRIRQDGGRWRGRRDEVWGDNYPGSSRCPGLPTYLAADPYPSVRGWSAGDLHHHTAYTADQVEFGAPPEVTAVLGGAAGCDWAALTDHSYDLDDQPESFLHNDPDRRRWRAFQREVETINRRGRGALLVPGEELSCGGEKGNIHLLVLGVADLIPGTGDGAERWFWNEPTLPLTEALRRIRRANGVAYAAHPFESVGALSRVAFKRGTWTPGDAVQEGVAGLQIWNGRQHSDLEPGIERWLRLLDAGRRLAIGAGNDAHGGFTLARTVRVPFAWMDRDRAQIYGRARTQVEIRGALSMETVVGGLSRGRSFVTNGPSLILTATSGTGDPTLPGDRVPGSSLTRITVRASSTAEFGAPERVDLWFGQPGAGERRLASGRPMSASPWSVELEVQAPAVSGPGWIRAELHGERASEADIEARALTNPIWLEPA